MSQTTKQYISNMNPANIVWLVPWEPIHEGHPDDALARELYWEISERHILHGIKVRPIARRQDCDDVLFELLDWSGRLAVVHLTYAQRPEPDPKWPGTSIYKDWSEFLKAMNQDAAEWNA